MVTEYGNKFAALLRGQEVLRNELFVCFLIILHIPSCYYSLLPFLHKSFVLYTISTEVNNIFVYISVNNNFN
jgi:hypothetical protein